jgi:transcriptional regulator with XRE-family HTH domain
MEKSDKKDRKSKKKQETGVDVKALEKIKDDSPGKTLQEIEKIANRTVTALEVQAQKELNQKQLDAIQLLSMGYTKREVANKVEVSEKELDKWYKIPNFVRELNGLTLREGLSDKHERIRQAKRIADELSNKMIEKLTSDEIDNLSIPTLSKLANEWASRLDSLVDEKEDKTVKDFTLMILSYVKESSGKHYDNFDEFIDEASNKYPVIDAEFEEIKND